MALFVDLDGDDVELPHALPNGRPAWESADKPGALHKTECGRDGAQDGAGAQEDPNRTAATAALGCYPIIMSIASAIDLNTLDSLSRTCRRVRAGLLPYRATLLSSTLRCSNEKLPVDADEALRYRARAANWFYMEDVGRTHYAGKSGQCARDMVSECRRCGTVVCRNCAIKPPVSIVLRDRHRRLCLGCTKAPIGTLVQPALAPGLALTSDLMRRAVCMCDTAEGVWLCQPCGRSIRGADYDYQAIWKWRNQYGEVLGGLGTGIGEGDRGVVCGRDKACCSAKEKEQETDCDAEDARDAEAEGSVFGLSMSPGSSSAGASAVPPPPWGGPGSLGSLGSLSNSSLTVAAADSPSNGRTPSPAALGPGYARHEIEGIGGVVKRKRVKMVRVGACVPEWEDEKAKGEILGREVGGEVRSWCGWCWRIIPGRRDFEADKRRSRLAEDELETQPED